MDIQLTVLCSFIILFSLVFQGLGFKFSIVHNNDIHGRYEPMQGRSQSCPKGDDEMGLCFGGIARIATAVRKARSEGPTLFLNGGGTFQGSTWYTIYKGELAAELLNLLRPDAVSLGNHEFDDNVEGLIPFLKKVLFPVLCCNLNLQTEPRLQGIKNLVPSTVLTKFKKKIGIIGYLTPETKDLVLPNNVMYLDEISSINKEADKLTRQGVNIIIALGHSGYEKDKEIATNCPDVDIVIGAHSHTFLYTGVPPSNEKPEGNYPTLVTKPDGRQVPVLHAYAYTKYLGKVKVEFDNGGNLIEISGAPILLDSSVGHDGTVRDLLRTKRMPIDSLEHQVVGTATVLLNGDGDQCRREECNLGNFISDAMVYARVIEGFGGLYWTDASIAVINSGGIRGSVDPGTSGSVTGSDILAILPFGNQVQVTRIKGVNLLKALEHSASLRNTDLDGGFLQVSGLRIVLNYNYHRGKRVKSVRVLCANCRIPKYEALVNDKYYSVIVPTFILNGGDGHKYFKNSGEEQNTTLQLLDREILTKYFQEHKVVYPKIDGRITIVEKTHISCASIWAQTVPVSLTWSITQYILYLKLNSF